MHLYYLASLLFVAASGASRDFGPVPGNNNMTYCTNPMENSFEVHTLDFKVIKTPPHEVAVSWNTELWIQDDIPDWQDIFIQVWANTSIWGNPDYKRRVQFCEWSTAQHCQGEWLPGSSITAQSEILYVTQFQERVFTYQILVWVNSTPIDNELCVSGVMDLTGYFASDKDGLVDQESVSGELK